MDLATTLAGLAAGAAIVNVVFHRAVPWGDGHVQRGWQAPTRASLGEEPDACPACGADAVTFGYEEEVDAGYHGVDVVRCPSCGWKQVLPPL